MNKKQAAVCTIVIALCFLYTGSAYMSECYRLMDHYSDRTTDIITSVINYLMQAIGIGIYMTGLRFRRRLFGDKRLFALLLVTGTLFMAVSQLSVSGAVIQASGYVFNLHIGFYFGFYLVMLSSLVSVKISGMCFGIAYAVASTGTYIMSLLDDDFLVSSEITVIYIMLAGLTMGFVLMYDDTAAMKCGEEREGEPLFIGYLIPLVVLVMIIFTVGSELFFSNSATDSINWNLVRAFYSAGLILAGIIYDRSRLAGEVLTAAFLTYPLICSALIGNGVVGTAVIAAGYAVRGFITLYYIVSFTDIGNKDGTKLYLAPLGLLVSRVTETIVSFVLLYYTVSQVGQMIFSSICFIPLIGLFVLLQNARFAADYSDEDKILGRFERKYNLTGREAQILRLLSENKTDQEIADELFISRNTVRFHISNMFKKTETNSRVEMIRLIKRR